MNSDGIELLDSVRHKNVKVDTSLVNIPVNQVNAAYIIVNEIANLSHEYPIFFRKDANTGQFGLVVLLGLHSGENLFIRDNKWHANYLPLDVLRRPFQAMLKEDDNFSGGRIAIDMHSEQVKAGKGEALFDESGNETAYLERVKQTFSQIMGGAEYTKDCMQKMAKLNLIESVSLKFDSVRGKELVVNGLYSINKDNLAALHGDELQLAHNEGLLQIAHLTMSSGSHIQKLINWSNE